MSDLDVAYQGPKRGADRAVLLAHGAGADMNAATLTTVAEALEKAQIPSLRFDFAYRAAGRRSPDRPPVLRACASACGLHHPAEPAGDHHRAQLRQPRADLLRSVKLRLGGLPRADHRDVRRAGGRHGTPT